MKNIEHCASKYFRVIGKQICTSFEIVFAFPFHTCLFEQVEIPPKTSGSNCVLLLFVIRDRGINIVYSNLEKVKTLTFENNLEIKI